MKPHIPGDVDCFKVGKRDEPFILCEYCVLLTLVPGIQCRPAEENHFSQIEMVQSNRASTGQ